MAKHNMGISITGNLAKCHPRRMEVANGLCRRCYYAQNPRMAECHPDKPYFVRGLCRRCHNRLGMAKYRATEVGRSRMRESQRRTYEKYRERYLVVMRVAYQKDRARRDESTKEYKRLHPEKAKKYRAGWKRNNRVKLAAYSANHRALKARNVGNYTGDEFLLLCKQYGNRCLWCGTNDMLLTADHVIPLSRGGSNSIENIQPLCQSCNSRKHRKSFDFRLDWT